MAGSRMASAHKTLLDTAMNEMNRNINPDLDNWVRAEQTLSKWERRARESQFSHNESAKAFENAGYWLGIPVVVLSSTVGTTVFATLQKQVSFGVQLGVGAISVLAAILAGLQTFLRFPERAEKHKTVAADYGTVRRQIEEILALSHASRGSSKECLELVRKKLDALAEVAPNVPTRIWNRTIRELGIKDSTDAARSRMS
jgi:hypothetical protein